MMSFVGMSLTWWAEIEGLSNQTLGVYSCHY
jgi:hypothetical protein